ncbi:hypothetical protein [Lishizhenia sp.]|uniref:hypothetical protein n=1 Tax=Lishizhenia sp. TaxID=2497594 RepID=UPI00299D0F8F|nr:hypothetical protein [Lishizhenia sp.]MDX1445027.1 hypothetical protein [Lishizhenia sp.]
MNQTLFLNDYMRFSKDGFVEHVGNREFNDISKYLTEKYGAQRIRLISFVVPDSVYFCEFYTYRDQVKCLVMDRNKNIFIEDSIRFDY